MSKALVIKGANFYNNRVGQVTFHEVVPCTGLTISSDTIAFTSIGSTQQLTANVTPADTTESLIWTSSDTNVATVADGLVTCVGVGEATITATCGEQSASCSVTSSVAISNLSMILHKGLTSTDLSLDPPKDYCSVYGTESGISLQRLTILSAEPTPSGIKCLTGTVFPNIYPIMLPRNATKVSLTLPSDMDYASGANWKIGIQFMDSTRLATYSVSNKGVLAKTDILRGDDYIVGRTCTYPIPDVDGIDSFGIGFLANAEINDTPEGILLTVS